MNAPVPWTVVRPPNRLGSLIVGGDGLVLAEVVSTDVRREWSNAHVMASAPELLAVLRRVVDEGLLDPREQTTAAVGDEIHRLLADVERVAG